MKILQKKLFQAEIVVKLVQVVVIPSAVYNTFITK